VSIYNDQLNNGSLWLRNSESSIETSSLCLSSVFSKYEKININFYNNLKDNNIKNFEVFYDVIFVETDNGYIVEKIYVDENDNKIYPLNNNNFLTLTRNTITKYWFDEKNLKIYFFDVIFDTQETNSLSFVFTLKEFDCKTGFLFLKLNELIYLELINSIDWGLKVPLVEPPVVSYNENTKCYNFSFLFRNNNLDIALMSLMIDNKKELELTDINAFIPFSEFGEMIHISR
jgi:hypothetical protein